MKQIDGWFEARGVIKVLLNVDIDNEVGKRFWQNNLFEPIAIRMKRMSPNRQ